MDASPRRINAKEVLTPQRSEYFEFQIADGTAKSSGRDHGVREATLWVDQPVRSEDLREDLQVNSEKSQPIDETKDDAEARNDFWSIEGDFIYRQVQLYVLKEVTFPIPLKYIDVTRTTHTKCCKKAVFTIIGTSMCFEVCHTHGQVSRKLHYRLKKKKNLQKDVCGPGGGSHKFKQLSDLIICGLKYGGACQKAAQKKEMHQWPIEKPMLDNVRKLKRHLFYRSG